MSQTKPSRPSLFEKIYFIVRQVPSGKVTTYGQVARICGECDARTVGYAMAAVKEDDIPWQRVINSQGKISMPGVGGASTQRDLLEAEGVVFDEKGRVDLARYQWGGLDDDQPGPGRPEDQPAAQPGLFDGEVK